MNIKQLIIKHINHAMGDKRIILPDNHDKQNNFKLYNKRTQASKSVFSSKPRRFFKRPFDLVNASGVLLNTASCSFREKFHLIKQHISCSWRVILYLFLRSVIPMPTTQSGQINQILGIEDASGIIGIILVVIGLRPLRWPRYGGLPDGLSRWWL